MLRSCDLHNNGNDVIVIHPSNKTCPLCKAESYIQDYVEELEKVEQELQELKESQKDNNTNAR